MTDRLDGPAAGVRVGPALPSTPRQVGLTTALFFTMLVSTLPEFTLGVLAPVLVDELVMGEAGIGVAAATMYLGAAIVARTGGRWLDDLGTRVTVLVVFGAAIGALVLLAASQSFVWLVPVGVLASVALGVNNPVTSRLVMAGVAPGRRGLAMGVKQSGVKVGQMLCGALLPWLSVSLGWREALLVAAGVAGVIMVGSQVALVDDPPARGDRVLASVADAREQVRWLQYFSLAMAVGQSALTTYLALYVVEELGFSLSRGGGVVAVFALTATISRLVWVTAVERLRHPGGALVLLAGGAVVGLVCLVAAPRVGVGALWAAVLVTGVTIGSWNVVVQFVVLTEVEAARVGSATGAVQAAFMFGMAVGAPVCGLIVQYADSFAAAWWVTIVVAATACTTALAHRGRARTVEDSGR